MKDEGPTFVLSTHDMESAGVLCDNIAWINRSHVVISGGVDEIRRKYGNNNVELIYHGSHGIASVNGVFNVISDSDDAGRHTAVISLEDGHAGNEVLSEAITSGLSVSGFKELVPRMNDIFIKLVTEEE